MLLMTRLKIINIMRMNLAKLVLGVVCCEYPSKTRNRFDIGEFVPMTMVLRSLEQRLIRKITMTPAHTQKTSASHTAASKGCASFSKDDNFEGCGITKQNGDSK